MLREEPPQPGNKAWGHPKAFVTPHIAAQASADTVANTVTQIIEQQMTGLDGMRYFSSSSTSAGTSRLLSQRRSIHSKRWRPAFRTTAR